MVKNLQVNKCEIQYDLTYKNIKNINLKIKFDGRVIVSAPVQCNLNEIENFIISKGDYVLNSLEKFRKIRESLPKEKKYVNGEMFKFLGSDLELKINIKQKNKVYNDNEYLYLDIKDEKDFRNKKNLIEKWMRMQGTDICYKMAQNVYRRFEEYNIKFPIIKVRKMKNRWGSCGVEAGVININSRLIEAPKVCIEYVMTHEFCHFIHPNHSRDFYNLLQLIMPTWKECKKILKNSVYLY